MTDPRTALRLAVYYRALSTTSFVLGAAIGLAGLWLGLADALAVLSTSFLQDDAVSRTLAAADLPLTAALVAVGVAVWQVGDSAAFYWTMTRALAPAAGDAEESRATGHQPAPDGPEGGQHAAGE